MTAFNLGAIFFCGPIYKAREDRGTAMIVEVIKGNMLPVLSFNGIFFEERAHLWMRLKGNNRPLIVRHALNRAVFTRKQRVKALG